MYFKRAASDWVIIDFMPFYGVLNWFSITAFMCWYFIVTEANGFGSSLLYVMKNNLRFIRIFSLICYLL